MNTKIYKRVHTLAESLMKAAHKKDQVTFDNCYRDLKLVCEEHENTDKDHPVQWETLADFTDDYELAITIYDKALVKAQAINSKDFLSSVGFSIASMKIEVGDKTGAIANLEHAKLHCNKIADLDLKAEISDLLEELTR